MKKLLFPLVVFLPVTAFAAANNVGSCGLGSKVFEGQKGVAPQVLAVTTNGTFGNQTFGITSGTLGCSQDGVVTSAWKTAMFIDGNKSQLARDAASGQGETLDALAALLKIDAQDEAAFVSLTKARHAEIFASVDSAETIATQLKAALQSDARLAKYADAV